MTHYVVLPAPVNKVLFRGTYDECQEFIQSPSMPRFRVIQPVSLTKVAEMIREGKIKRGS